MAEASTALPDMEAISYNPAALHGRGRGSMGFTHSEFFQDIRHEHFSLVFVPNHGVVGFAAQIRKRTISSAAPVPVPNPWEDSAFTTACSTWPTLVPGIISCV